MADPIVVPPGTPPADPNAPTKGLTQAQIDAIAATRPPWLKPWVTVAVVVIPLLLAGAWFGGKSNAPQTGPSPDAIHIAKALLEPVPTTPKKADPVTPPVPVVPGKPTIKISPVIPKSGEIATITTDAVGPLYDFEGVFTSGQAVQNGQSLSVAIPKSASAQTYVIRCIYQFNGGIVMDHVTINAAGDQPTPPTPDVMAFLAKLDARLTALETAKPPVVPPTPVPANATIRHITFIGAETTPVSMAVNNDAGLRTSFKNANVSVHVLKANDPLIASSGLSAAVASAGGLPCWVAQDDLAHVIAHGPMRSAADVLAAVTPFMKR